MTASTRVQGAPRSPVPWQHRGVRATRPVRFVVALLLGASMLGPQSLRFGSREADAVLQADLTTDVIALAHGALILAASIVGLVLFLSQPVRAYWSGSLGASRQARATVRCFLAWVMFAGVSILWSIAPMFTAISWLRLIGLAALSATLVAFGRDRLSIIRFVWWFAATKIAATLSLAALDPSLVGRQIPVGYRMTGGVLPDYGVSGVLLVATTLALYRGGGLASSPITRLLHRRWFVYGCVTVGVGVTLLARSRFSILALLALLALVTWSARARLLALFAGSGALGLALLDGAALSDAAFTVVFRERAGATGFSKRDVALEHVLAWSADDRLVGAGFAAGSRTAMVDFMRQTGIAMGAPHDALSAVIPDTGLVGLALLLAVAGTLVWGLFTSVRTLRERALHPQGVFTAALVLLALAGSVASAGIASADMLAIIPVLAVVLLSTERGLSWEAHGVSNRSPALASRGGGESA